MAIPAHPHQNLAAQPLARNQPPALQQFDQPAGQPLEAQPPQPLRRLIWFDLLNATFSYISAIS